MWIFNDDGFFSTVADTENEGNVLVRGRDERSIMRFCVRCTVPFDQIQVTPERDYPVRVSVPQQDWVNYVSNRAENIDYPDFKTHCKASTYNGHHSGFSRQSLHAMGAVWAVMFERWFPRPDEYAMLLKACGTGGELERRITEEVLG